MNSNSSDSDNLDSESEDPNALTNEISESGGIESTNDTRVGNPFVAQIADEKTDAEASRSAHMTSSSPITATLVVSPASNVPLANELKNISAIGGAVGAVVLGVWSILCSLITPFSAINALLALMLGAYGLNSNKKKLAVIGMVLGAVGLAMSLIETNEILNKFIAEEAAG